MRIAELARRTAVTPKAIRYYETLGLLRPERGANGYREYQEHHVRIVTEIRELAASGIGPGKARPFVDCLHAGHEHGDDCVTSLAVYRDGIAELDRMIATLTARRTELIRRLDEGAGRTFSQESTMSDFTTLPAGLPIPDDDGAAAHLPGLAVPELTLSASDGERVAFGGFGPGRTIVYLYPLTGRPGVDLPDGWDAIPGARGCSTEACDFRDHFAELRAAGADRVFGLSSQDTGYQAEVVARLRLPFTMLSDPDFVLGDALRLPSFAAEGQERLYSRLTLVLRGGRIEHVFYPIFPPNTHAQQVLDWLRANPLG
ncbi:MerR family transcriptional regulator [Arthrobacter sp. NPDC090010]|uniref:MerR family transcriptional regulator n=1 Tax=Arthrobacter sp. NPDC090010 TaxID=3363942 RepID=UPI0037F17573